MNEDDKKINIDEELKFENFVKYITSKFGKTQHYYILHKEMPKDPKEIEIENLKKEKENIQFQYQKEIKEKEQELKKIEKKATEKIENLEKQIQELEKQPDVKKLVEINGRLYDPEEIKKRKGF